MPKSIGGRGHKAAYTTTHVRVPEPIKPEVQRLIDNFHDNYSADSTNLLPGLPEAIVIAKGILTQKKSAKVSISKLLTALYKTDVEIK